MTALQTWEAFSARGSDAFAIGFFSCFGALTAFGLALWLSQLPLWLGFIVAFLLMAMIMSAMEGEVGE